MINLEDSISQIEALLTQNTDASLSYAALECRLAIECICYERLRVAHDYISHEDLRSWEPRDVVNILIQEVDSKTAETFTLSVSRQATHEGSPPPSLEDFEAMEFLLIGTQIGFDPKKLGRLWNALANLALHVSVPTNKTEGVSRYGSREKVRAKVAETLTEIRRIGLGTLTSSGIGNEVSFQCICGAKNKRRLGLLKDGQTISCIKFECKESYDYVESDMSFARRTIEIVCKNCDERTIIPKKEVEKLRTDRQFDFVCAGCAETISISWTPMQAQAKKPSASTG